MIHSTIPQRLLILTGAVLALGLTACGGSKEEGSPPPTLITSLDDLATQAARQGAGTPATPTPNAPPTSEITATPLPTLTLTFTPSPSATPSPTPTVLLPEQEQATGIALTQTALAEVMPFTQTAAAVMEATQTAFAQITLTPAPTLTPPGPPQPFQVIYYTNRNGSDDIYLMTLNGVERRLVAGSTNEREPSCAPDGQSFVFASDATGSYQLYLQRMDQPTALQLTNSEGMNFAPVFSPDGLKIAFVSTRSDGIPTIWVMNTDGSEPEQITTELGRDTSPAWGPDGRQLLFSSDQSGPWNLFLTVLEEEVEGEFPILPPEFSTRNQLWPFFDSQGERIVYTVWDDLADPQTSDIYLLDFEEEAPRTIRQGAGADIAWAWADETHLLASVGGPDDVQIALVDVSTGQAAPLTQAGTFNGGARLCVVSPDILPPEPTPAILPTATSTPTVTPTPPPTETAFSPELMAAAGHRHIVQPGDTLVAIGYRYGVNWKSLSDLNNLENPDRLSVGQTLTVPLIRYAPSMHGGFVEPGGEEAVQVGVRKEIVVDLSDQTATALEDGRSIREVLVSTGLPDSPTVLGEYSIYDKRDAQTMTGHDYYLPDVPYVMYFYQGYGLHGTYWHDNFGHPMSHGCVNLPTPEAAWFYTWAEIGTPVLVQE